MKKIILLTAIVPLLLASGVSSHANPFGENTEPYGYPQTSGWILSDQRPNGGGA